MKLFVDAPDFCDSFKNDVSSARKSIYAQTLSFEADEGGNFLAEQFYAADGLDRRLVIDRYTRHIQNDRFILSPTSLIDKDFMKEVSGTFSLVKEFRRRGIQVQWVNPLGVMMRKMPARNHKKIIAVDSSVAYIGGINFSAHNFAWHDLMVRFDEPEIVEFLKNDFELTWHGKNQGCFKSVGGVSFSILDGVNSEEYCQPILSILRSAKKRIFVESPYLSTPYYEVLGEAAARGVEVIVLAPAANNWGPYDFYTRWEAHKNKLDLRYYHGGMTHLKAILVDDSELIVGSSNFDYFSFRLHQEIMAVIRDRTIIQDFILRVMEPDLAQSKAAESDFDFSLGKRAEWRLRKLFRAAHFVNKGFIPKSEFAR